MFVFISVASPFPVATASTFPWTYSGRLVDDQGKPRVGSVDLEFSFYDDDKAVKRLGESPYRRNVNLVDGVFQVTLELLGEEAASIFAGHDAVWIEVMDIGANKIYPRQRFSYVPYALRVPVDGATLGYDATTGQLKVLTVPTTGITSVIAGTGLIENTSNGTVTLHIDVGSTANKIVQLDGNGKVAAGVLPVGNTANTVAAGNDVRFNDARTPTGTAGGDLSGTYPNPTLKSSTTTDANRAIGTDHIKTASITLAKLASDSVDSSKIVNGSIIDVDIASNATISDTKLATLTSANKVANSATSASSTAGNNTIVMRDASGNFSAGTISANLIGTVTGNITGTAANVTDTVAVANGGTGATNATAALNNLLPSQTSHSGKVLQSDGTNVAWATLNISNWDTAYNDRLTWDGGATNLNATTARTSLGLGTGATLNAGTAANNLVQIDATGKLPAVDGSQLTNLPAATLTCPSGYVLVPADGNFTRKNFCVMKYEAKKNPTTGQAESTASGLPWTNISWFEAKAACKRIGAHLINDGEWMTIARNIEATLINDIDSSDGIQLATGHSDATGPLNALAATTDPELMSCTLTASLADASNNSGALKSATEPYHGTGDSFSVAYSAGVNGKSQMRTHVLSNGNIVWDMAGNLREWVDAQCDTNNWSANINWPNGYDEWNEASLTDWEKLIAGPSGSLTSANGAGRYFGCSKTGNALIRGGGLFDAWDSGVFAAYMWGDPSDVDTIDLGFRCALGSAD